MKTVSCIGLGLLGSAMTARLIEHGWVVRGFDVLPDRLTDHQNRGGEVADSIEAAADSPLMLLSLPNSDIVEEVLPEIEAGALPNAIVIDTTTGRPEQMESFASRLAESGIAYVDATVGGSSQVARDGEAILMCGGDRTVFDSCTGLFQDLARQTFYCGPSGAGARMKLVTNLVLGLNRAVLAEGLSFARSLGVAGELALDVLKAGPAWSRAMDHKGKKMLSGEFEPQARLGQHLKDVKLILNLAKDSDAFVPFSTLHAGLLEKLAECGDGDLDNSAIIRAFTDE